MEALLNVLMQITINAVVFTTTWILISYGISKAISLFDIKP